MPFKMREIYKMQQTDVLEHKITHHTQKQTWKYVKNTQHNE